MSDALITGIGVAAPNGVGLENYWAATLKGVSAVRPATRFDTAGHPVVLAAEVPESEAEAAFPRRLHPQTDRLTRLALLSSDEALADAGIDPAALDGYAMGTAVTGVTGGLEFGQRQLQLQWGTGWESVSPYMSFAWYYAVHTGQVSIRHGMRGPGGVVVSEQAGGLDSLAFARRRVRTGTAVMTAGGFDSMLCPYGMSVLSVADGVSRDGDPARAGLPFCAASTGFVPGEGGAVLVVEPGAGAAERGAPHRYGLIAGHGAAFDPDPAGSGGSSRSGLLRAARAALRDAGLTPDDIGVVFADGVGSGPLDRAEAAVLTGLFGSRRVPVSAPKALVGRMLSGGSALDVVAALLTLRDGLIPAVPGVRREDVDPRVELVVGEPRAERVESALVLARGHGGFASALVLTRA
ncbi:MULTISPECIES: beta-ketoacyl synthase N-terminal-like domain-containing protein [unclassified Streptomyces]|uniref:beta-ketoacyl synthase N-terminal-like domain-containing protein n=1 Tax=unclassified Streptomyces TaxID=2593676 RepID=UPI0018D709BC|nr:beta-ketoacyl synthase N-terminal-like domain-containing protein [Streptomyces sp. HB-N217]MBH5129538.1 ketosynthase chain-length factor [Streptomyces sp. HB-N217]QPM92742.1 keto synthase beta [Streptomyces sp.]